MRVVLLAAAFVGAMLTVVPVNAAHRGGGVSTGTVVPNLVPGSGSCPAVDASLHGSGSAQMPPAAFDEAPYMWTTQGVARPITIVSGTSNRAWIHDVKACINGNTVTLPPVINSVTGTYGWTFTPTSVGSTDGDYTVSAYITPVDGYQRLITLPVTLNNNATISRAVRFVDWVAGSDSNTGLPSSAWKTIAFALANIPDGGMLFYECGTGGIGSNPETYLEDTTGGFNSNTRMIDVLPDPNTCTGGASAVISRTARTSPDQFWSVRANRVRLEGLTIDMSKIVGIEGAGLSSTTVFTGWTQACNLTDPNGPDGPTYGYSEATTPQEFQQSPFVTQFALDYFEKCNFVTVDVADPELLLDANTTTGWDEVALDNFSDGLAYINVNESKDGEMDARWTSQQPSSVAVTSTSVAGSGGCPSGTSVTTLNLTSGTTLFNFSGVDAYPNTEWVAFIDGPLSGQKFQFYSISPGTPSVSLYCDATSGGSVNLVGSHVFIYTIAHGDCLQIVGLQPAHVISNLVFQRYKCVLANGGDYGDLQALLLAPENNAISGTFSSSGTTVTMTAPATFQAGDCFQAISGPQQYEGHPVAVGSTGTTVTLSQAFSVNQTSQTYAQGNTLKDVLVEGSIFSGDRCGEGPSGCVGDFAQWQGCEINVSIVQTTIDKNSVAIANNDIGMGLWQDAMYDDIFNGASSEATPSNASSYDWNCDGATCGGHNAPWPSNSAYSFDVDNFQLGYFNGGLTYGTHQISSSVTFASVGTAGTYKPSGGTVTTAVIGEQGGVDPNGTPLFPYTYDGTHITIGAVIGAQQP